MEYTCLALLVTSNNDMIPLFDDAIVWLPSPRHYVFSIVAIVYFQLDLLTWVSQGPAPFQILGPKRVLVRMARGSTEMRYVLEHLPYSVVFELGSGLYNTCPRGAARGVLDPRTCVESQSHPDIAYNPAESHVFSD